MAKKRKKVGVALSGGGSKGIAHIGVLKVLEDYGIPIDFISGTSIGSVIGSLYCAGYTTNQLEELFTGDTREWKNLFDYTFPKHGLIKGKKIEKFLEEELKDIQFKDLKIPLYITSFDIIEKQEIIFNKGSVSKAVRASISIPGMIVPVENNNRVLVDGGVIDPIPTEVLKKAGADIVIAVNVNERKIKKPKFDRAVDKKRKRKIPGIWEIASKSFKVMAYEIYQYDLTKKGIDFVINISLKNKDMMKFSKKANRKAIKEGETAAKKSLDEIKNATKTSPFKKLIDKLSRLDEKMQKEKSKAMPAGKVIEYKKEKEI